MKRTDPHKRNFAAMLIQSMRIATFAALFLPTVAGAEPTTLKLSFFTSDRSTIYQCQLKPFVDAVNGEGSDQVRIDVEFARGDNAVLANQPKLLSEGIADIVDIPLMAVPALFPDSSVLLMPGLFANQSEGNRVLIGLAEAGKLRGYENFIVLGAYVSAGENIHSRKPIDALAALRGQTIRVSNQIEANTLKRFGATPVLLPINETMDSIGQGKVDGVTAPPVLLFEFGFGRITSNHYMLVLGSVPAMLVMNRTKFMTLPAGAQEVIRKYSGVWLSEQAASCLETKGRETIALLNADMRRKVVSPSPADQATADKIFATVTEEWAAQSPRNRELLKLVKAEIARVRAVK